MRNRGWVRVASASVWETPGSVSLQRFLCLKLSVDPIPAEY